MRLTDKLGGHRAPRERIDFGLLARTIDLRRLIEDDLGSPLRSGRWACPFHQDASSPNFAIGPDGRRWCCWSCGLKGDAIDYVARRDDVSTVEAARRLDPTLGENRRRGRRPPPTPPRAQPAPRIDPMGPEAVSVVEAAERRLWTPRRAEALTYLHGRGLADATIRAARLGAEGRKITIPWFDGDRLIFVNVRRPAGSDPKYMAMKGGRRHGLYPGAPAIRPGLPAIVVEGELDCLLLAQELEEMASVVTLGSAGMKPTPAIQVRMVGCWPWFLATDADEAGDRAATLWGASAGRVRPPTPHKDWTDAHKAGVNLRRWWRDILARVDRQQLYTWEELAGWRWGPSSEDPEPGIVVDHPDRNRMLHAVSSVLADPQPDPNRGPQT